MCYQLINYYQHLLQFFDDCHRYLHFGPPSCCVDYAVAVVVVVVVAFVGYAVAVAVAFVAYVVVASAAVVAVVVAAAVVVVVVAAAGVATLVEVSNQTNRPTWVTDFVKKEDFLIDDPVETAGDCPTSWCVSVIVVALETAAESCCD